VTTYIALSPKRRTEHTTWEGARDALVDDADRLSKQKHRDPATQGLFEMAREAVKKSPRGPLCWDWYDTWGNKIKFQVVEQEQFPI
jgi:hypothetical protein